MNVIFFIAFFLLLTNNFLFLDLRLRKKHVETPYTVDVSVLEGHVSPLNSSKDEPFSGELELATVSLQRGYMVPGVRRIEIRQNQVVGTLFLPPG